jgi:hypothetical protein
MHKENIAGVGEEQRNRSRDDTAAGRIRCKNQFLHLFYIIAVNLTLRAY